MIRSVNAIPIWSFLLMWMSVSISYANGVDWYDVFPTVALVFHHAWWIRWVRPH